MAWLPLALQVIALVGIMSVACYRLSEVETRVDKAEETFVRRDVLEEKLANVALNINQMNATMARIERRLDALPTH